MGRELKRVPLDFDWSLDKVWEGFINPHYDHSHQCHLCGGDGLSLFAKFLRERWYGNARFRPEDRGSTPFIPEHPVIQERARRNVAGNPAFFGCSVRAVKQEAKRLADLFNSRWQHHLNEDDVAALLEAGRLMDLTHTWSKET